MSNEIYTCIMQGEIPIEPTPDKRRHELVVFSKADSILCRVCSVGIFPLFLGFPCSSEIPHAVRSEVLESMVQFQNTSCFGLCKLCAFKKVSKPLNTTPL